MHKSSRNERNEKSSAAEERGQVSCFSFDSCPRDEIPVGEPEIYLVC